MESASGTALKWYQCYVDRFVATRFSLLADSTDKRRGAVSGDPSSDRFRSLAECADKLKRAATLAFAGLLVTWVAFAQAGGLFESALSRAHSATASEREGEWGKALGEYEKVLDPARAAVQSDEQRGTPGARGYFLLGLAETDYARMLRQLQSGHMFSADYEDHLRAAARDFEQSIELSKGRKGFLPVAYEYLAVARLLLGDLKTAEDELRKASKLNSKEKGASEALARLTTMSPGMRHAAATLVSTPGALTLPQRQGLVDFGYAVAARISPPATSVIESGLHAATF